MAVKNKIKRILEIDSDLNRVQDLDLLLDRVLYEARRSANADAGTLYIKEKGKLSFKYSHNDTKRKELDPGQKLIYSYFTVDINEESISGYVAANQIPLNIPDMYNIPKSKPYSYSTWYDEKSNYKCVSSLTIPLVSNQGEVLGVLQLINAKDDEGNIVRFKKTDESFLMHFASVATVAIQRAQMTRQLLLRMIQMAEMRDPKETGPHVKRVAGYAVELYEEWARRKKIDQGEIEKNKDILRMAAMLHDVGKVGISDLILKKPGRFTEEEFLIMQSHAYIGAQLFFGKQSEFDQMSMEISLYHHENWDGSGYPGHIDLETGRPLDSEVNAGGKRGLEGEEIPIMARIVSLADVYDALSCRRVYKEAWDEERVYEELRKTRGKKFDPELIDIFFDILPHILQVKKQYPDVD
ncbi:GAF and HD-GYP domain-containing protein [Spirochaeta isovalerica]|uniref:HD-GYP domain-containing protein (C-di-GMP phosphodiesterase class II) n=1 Tax=Spirochaeta isovalerica TaxID=150 RepID=A0A841RAR3_9SPIO|nr:HD domain-containing phosphohydrolase [Spirochaeta isovalerica]MBB6481035.1 HD-GYP domain-containing protein (c-di-GMP phosphodiesterase class II) [Spirochaeta isovalerica]